MLRPRISTRCVINARRALGPGSDQPSSPFLFAFCPSSLIIVFIFSCSASCDDDFPHHKGGPADLMQYGPMHPCRRWPFRRKVTHRCRRSWGAFRARNRFFHHPSTSTSFFVCANSQPAIFDQQLALFFIFAKLTNVCVCPTLLTINFKLVYQLYYLKGGENRN